MRLDQRIAKFSHYSRSEAKRCIRQGGVLVDGNAVKNPAQHVTYDQSIHLQGELLAGQAAVYIMLNKPVGVVSARKDDQHPTVLGLIDVANQQDLVIAGRLDIDTTGLLLLSDDGAWVHRLMSPKHKQGKVYRVQLAEPLTESQAQALQAGVMLNGEEQATLPAELEVIDPRCILLTIYEGRYHQVKRMLAAVGNHVNSLHRQQVSTIVLDDTLATGEWRYLREDEIKFP